MSSEQQAVVMDNGSGLCKVGLSGECSPRCVVPSVVGWPLPRQRMVEPRSCSSSTSSSTSSRFYVGDEVQDKRGVLSVRYPIQHGVITSWDDMSKVWSHAYKRLRVRPHERPLLMTEPPLNPTRNRQLMAETAFEGLGVPALHVASQGLLALYARGETTGLVVDCGDGVTHSVPVFDGFVLSHAVMRLDLAGRDVTDHLARTLRDGGHVFMSTAEKEIVRDMKERLCYVALDCASEAARPRCDIEARYRLPDGAVVSVREQRFRAPEALFRPDALGLEALGLHQLAWASVMRSEIDLRRHLYGNVVLSGGTTMLPGLDERLSWELSRLAPPGAVIKTMSSPERRFAVWIGGSILAGLSAFSTTRWLSAAEYREAGPSALLRYCS
ncbi:actin-1-like [Petromyzon marinus]|uniref:Actin, clone 302-like n=1 Tax=Petromyzon marinus TaxID=7757 RepID=A0AAJ7UJX3_PETMA|nr:actin, clone 302-like [Petromyzon marinus]